VTRKLGYANVTQDDVAFYRRTKKFAVARNNATIPVANPAGYRNGANMANLPNHERAEQIWRESLGSASAQDIANVLFEEGRGKHAASKIRTWKARNAWKLARELALASTDTATVSVTFEQAADALRVLGVKAAGKLAEFVERVDASSIKIDEAETLSRIMREAVGAAASLDNGVIARFRADREKAAARNGDGAKVIDGVQVKSPVDQIVQMFERGGRRG
jgi:hypothetical protein